MIRKIFTFIGSVLLMLLLAIILLPFLFPIENYRADILKLVQEKTGREVTISGELDFALLPDIAIEVNQVTVGNPEGFVSPHFAKIGTLHLKMALWPLMSKQLEVNELAVEEAEVYLEEAVGGKKNWEFKTAKISKMADTEQPKAQNSNFKLNIERLSVEDTKLHYIKPGQKISTENVNLDYSEGEAELDLVLKHANTRYQLTLETPNSHTLFDTQKTPLTVAMRSPLIRADFAGDLLGVNLSAGQFDTQLVGNLTAGVTGVGKVTSRKFSANTKQASLELLTLESTLGVSATGEMAVNYSGKKPKVNTTLAIPELDLNRLLPSEDKADKQAGLLLISSAYAMEPWSKEPVNLTMLNVVDADAKLSIEKLITTDYTLNDFATSLRLAGGILNVHNYKAGLLGGDISGIATSGANGQWNSTLVVKNIPFEKLAEKHLEDVAVTGMTNGNLSLNSQGKSVHDWMQHLAGGGNLTINDGIIKGFSLPKLFRKAIGLNPDAVTANANENTPFTAITTAFSIDKGVAKIREGSLRSPRLKADTSGTVSLATQQIDLLLTPELLPKVEPVEGEPTAETAAAEVSGLMVPVKVTGSFDKVKVKPDYSRTIGNILKDPKKFEDTLKQFKPEGKAIEDSLEPSKDAIKQNWKDLKENKNPDALKNIFNELDKNGVNPLNLLNGQN